MTLINRSKSIAALVLLSILVSCNKSSNELPPIKNEPVALSVPVSINGTEKFKVIFLQNKYGTTDTVDVYVENSGQDTAGIIDSVTLLLEICSGTVANYDNCKQSPVLRFDTLSGATRRKVFSFYNDKIALTSQNIKVAVLKYNDFARPFSGIYEHPASAAEFFQDTVYKYSGVARGYIQYNGDAVFHLKVTDTAQYDITGRFEENTSFSGNLFSAGKIVTRVTYDSVKNAAGIKVPANFENNGLHDSLSLVHSLSDNVNHITLTLKK